MAPDPGKTFPCQPQTKFKYLELIYLSWMRQFLAIRSHCPIQINSFVFSAKCSIANLVVFGTISGPGSGCIRFFELINLNPDPINLTFPDLPVCLYGLGGQFLNSNIFVIFGEDEDDNCRIFKLAKAQQWEEMPTAECQCTAQAKSIVIHKNPSTEVNRIHQFPTNQNQTDHNPLNQIGDENLLKSRVTQLGRSI